MNRRDPLRSQKGFSLITALFILLVLAALGTFMVTMSGVQSRTSLWAFQGAQAYHAARSGLEWGTFQALNSSCVASTTLNVGNFNVTLQCQAQGAIAEGGQSYYVYQLTSLAEWGTYGNGDYISRLLRARVTGATP
jgi:MSHA biogenesis protein MshP